MLKKIHRIINMEREAWLYNRHGRPYKITNHSTVNATCDYIPDYMTALLQMYIRYPNIWNLYTDFRLNSVGFFRVSIGCLIKFLIWKTALTRGTQNNRILGRTYKIRIRVYKTWNFHRKKNTIFSSLKRCVCFFNFKINLVNKVKTQKKKEVTLKIRVLGR